MVKPASPTASDSSDSAVCQICFDGSVWEDNEIVFCSDCDVPVHQVCYGVKTIPFGDWRCAVCQAVHDKVPLYAKGVNQEVDALGQKAQHLKTPQAFPDMKVSKRPAMRECPVTCVLCPSKEGLYFLALYMFCVRSVYSCLALCYCFVIDCLCLIVFLACRSFSTNRRWSMGPCYLCSVAARNWLPGPGKRSYFLLLDAYNVC